MSRLAEWIFVCVVVSLILRNRPVWSVFACILIYSTIPISYISSVTGSVSLAAGIHPATWLSVTTITVSMLIQGPAIIRELRTHTSAYWWLFLAMIVGATTTADLREPSMLIMFFVIIGIPIALFVIARAGLNGQTELIPALSLALVWLAVLESVLGIVQWYTKSLLIFPRRQPGNEYWATPGQVQRAAGTLESPLDLAFLALAAIPLATCIRRRGLRLATYGVLSSGILATQSRQALLIGLCIIIFCTLFSRGSAVLKSGQIAILGLMGVLLAGSTIANGTLTRLNGADEGSSSYRSAAYQYTLHHVRAHVLIGDGFGSTFDLKGRALASSLENGYVMLAFDIGVIATIIIMGFQLVLMFSGSTSVSNISVRASGVGLVIMCLGFSSIENIRGPGPILWVYIALASCLGIRSIPSAQREIEHAAGSHS